MKRLIPLGLYARRLAPYVARGLLDYHEVHDCLVEAAFRRLVPCTAQLWHIENWLARLLAREIAACQAQPHPQRRAA